ncbi:MAG: hypothetical protein KJ626_00570 [Verrucomicrobia bacterium]|nr:hypothetical protein [Verrucomicrobiota bacterium]
MKTENNALIIFLCLSLAFGAVLMTGCEETTESSDGNVIIFSASTNVLTGVGAVVTWTVTNAADASLFLPLIWTADDTSLGNITAAEGVTAVYESTGKVGNNTVTVRDQGDAIGITVVIQR